MSVLCQERSRSGRHIHTTNSHDNPWGQLSLLPFYREVSKWPHITQLARDRWARVRTQAPWLRVCAVSTSFLWWQGRKPFKVTAQGMQPQGAGWAMSLQLAWTFKKTPWQKGEGVFSMEWGLVGPRTLGLRARPCPRALNCPGRGLPVSSQGCWAAQGRSQCLGHTGVGQRAERRAAPRWKLAKCLVSDALWTSGEGAGGLSK